MDSQKLPPVRIDLQKPLNGTPLTILGTEPLTPLPRKDPSMFGKILSFLGRDVVGNLVSRILGAILDPKTGDFSVSRGSAVALLAGALDAANSGADPVTIAVLAVAGVAALFARTKTTDVGDEVYFTPESDED